MSTGLMSAILIGAFTVAALAVAWWVSVNRRNRRIAQIRPYAARPLPYAKCGCGHPKHAHQRGEGKCLRIVGISAQAPRGDIVPTLCGCEAYQP